MDVCRRAQGTRNKEASLCRVQGKLRGTRRAATGCGADSTERGMQCKGGGKGTPSGSVGTTTWRQGSVQRGRRAAGACYLLHAAAAACAGCARGTSRAGVLLEPLRKVLQQGAESGRGMHEVGGQHEQHPHRPLQVDVHCREHRPAQCTSSNESTGHRTVRAQQTLATRPA